MNNFKRTAAAALLIGFAAPCMAMVSSEMVSVNDSGVQGDGISAEQSINEDGRYVAFHSYSTNLVAGDNNGFADVFVYDRENDTIERVSLDAGGAQSTTGDSLNPSIRGDGRYVAFESTATDLIGVDANGAEAVTRSCS